MYLVSGLCIWVYSNVFSIEKSILINTSLIVMFLFTLAVFGVGYMLD